MTERICSDEVMQCIMRTCYEAGSAGRERYTVRVADGPAVVRCRDCVHCDPAGVVFWCSHWENGVEPDGYCAWGRRAE